MDRTARQAGAKAARHSAYLVAAVALALAITGASSDIPQLDGSTEPSASDAQAIRDYYTDGGYEADVASIAAKTETYLESACEAPNAAIVIDVDDTTLLTYPLQEKTDFVIDRTLKARWVKYEKFPAVPGMVDLLDAASESGCRILAITGRPVAQTKPTIANLVKVGYPSLARFSARPVGDTRTVVQFKSAMRAKFARTYDIVANLGDQDSDLAGGKSGRKVKLPNPMYEIG